jgi:hypothetical protein
MAPVVSSATCDDSAEDEESSTEGLGLPAADPSKVRAAHWGAERVDAEGVLDLRGYDA